MHLDLPPVCIPLYPPATWLSRCLSLGTLRRSMSVVSITYKHIFGNVTIYFIGLFSSTNVLTPQLRKILKQTFRKRGLFVSGGIGIFYFAQLQSPSADIHIHIYEHFPGTLIVIHS